MNPKAHPKLDEVEQKKPLLDQSIALQSYMQELLNEVVWSEPELEPGIKQASSDIASVNTGSIDEVSYVEPPLKISRDILPPAGKKLQTLADLEAEFDPEVEASQIDGSGESVVRSLVENSDAGHTPVWAGDSFRALYARHGSLKLVMPLVHVKTVLKAKELVRVEEPLSAFIGYVQHGTQRIPVLDLSALNGAIEKPQSGDAEEFRGYVAIAEDHAVGLYFKEINDTHEIQTQAVNWRFNDESATWIAGIEPQNLSIIVDFNRLCDLL